MVCGVCSVTTICDPGFQIAGGLRFGAQELDRRHHIGSLRVICLAQCRRPTQVLRHVIQDGGELGQRLHTWIPWLRVHGLHERRTSEAALMNKVISGFDLVRKRCSSKNLGYQRVRVQGDGSCQLLQLLRGQRNTLSRISGRWCRLLGSSFKWHRCDHQQQRQRSAEQLLRKCSDHFPPSAGGFLVPAGYDEFRFG